MTVLRSKFRYNSGKALIRSSTQYRMSSDKSDYLHVLRASAVKMLDDQWISQPILFHLSMESYASSGETLMKDLFLNNFTLGVYLKPFSVYRRFLTVVKHM